MKNVLKAFSGEELLPALLAVFFLRKSFRILKALSVSTTQIARMYIKQIH